MDNFTYKKEQLIWMKENFVTEELCDDIVEIIDILKKENQNYENVFSCAGVLSTDDLELSICNKMSLISVDEENISKYKTWERIKPHLINELNREIEKYSGMVNSKLIFTKETTNRDNFSTLCFNYLDGNNFNFFINNNKGEVKRTEKFYVKDMMINQKILKYVLFLNDYDGEIVFWKDYIIRPQKGNMILFPLSWCFPYYENTKIDAKNITAYGFVSNVYNFNK
jgi:hypothetical protein